MKTINALNVRSFWDYMQGTFGLKVRKKGGLKYLSIVATAIDSDWRDFSITLGDTLYTDVTPGESESSLISQIALITHECQHRVQNKRDTFFYTRYVTSSRKRMRYEVEAFAATIDTYYYLTYRLLTTQHILEVLEKYRLKESDMSRARISLDNHIEQIKSGEMITDAGKKMRLWWS